MTSVFKRLAIVGVLVITATACQAPTSSAPKAQYIDGGTLTLRMSGDWTTLDTIELGGTRVVNQGLYDRMLAVGPKNEIIPYIATSWQATDTEITFKVRNDVKCADGAALTPTAMANSYKRLFDPATKFGSLVNGYGPGPYTVVADDAASTVKFTFVQPFSPRMYQFATDPIVCPAGIANPALLKDQPQGSGPYKLESAVHKDKVVLTLRPEWAWGPANTTSKTVGLPGRIELKYVENETTAANLLLSGGLDIAAVAGADVPRLQQEKSLSATVNKAFAPHFIGFNQTPGLPTADQAVREALMSLFDPKEYNQAAFLGYGGTVATSYLTEDVPCYDPETAKLLPKPSAETTKQKLMAAGYTMGANGKLVKDGKPLALTTNGTSQFGSAPEYILNQMNAVGITANLVTMDRATYNNSMLQGKFDLTIIAVPAAIPDPSVATKFLTGAPAAGNFARINDPELDAAIAKARLVTSGPEMCKNWSTVQRILLQKSHVLPLAAPSTFTFSKGFDFVISGEALQYHSLRRRAP